MSTNIKLHLEQWIAATPARVYDCVTDPQHYRDWASAFCEGSYFEGDWTEGAAIRFLGPEGGGITSQIAQNKPGEFLSIRHLGWIQNGVDDTQSEAVCAIFPAYENYTFVAEAAGTRFVLDQEVTEQYLDYMKEAWPRALARLKSLCEAKT